MKKSIKWHTIVSIALLSLGAFCMSIDGAYANNLVQIGRYTSVGAGPTQAEINPLDAVAAFRFPTSVKTVGEALTIVLANTGFRIASKNTLSADVKSTLNMPLPVTNRVLGLMSIKDSIAVLMGRQVYTPNINLLKRTVNFRLNRAYQPKVAHKKHHKTAKKKPTVKHLPLKGARHAFI